MNKTIGNFLGGLAGAVALNTIHQLVKSFNHDAPRVDLIGEEALSKVMESAGLTPPTGDALFAATLAGDVLSNTMYYSGIGLVKKRHLLLICKGM